MQRVLTALLALALWGVANADDTAARQLNEALRQIDSMSAEFQQHSEDRNGGHRHDVQGHMTVARPGFFRWETDEPYAQKVVADGHTIWVYDPDLNQVVIQSLDRQVGNTPALLLSSDSATIDHAFAVQKAQASAGDVAFMLVPRASDAMFAHMQLVFSHDQLRRMELVDLTGQHTVITFSQVQYHVHPPVADFHFRVPAGADVVKP